VVVSGVEGKLVLVDQQPATTRLESQRRRPVLAPERLRTRLMETRYRRREANDALFEALRAGRTTIPLFAEIDAAVSDSRERIGASGRVQRDSSDA